jgi:predicted permease
MEQEMRMHLELRIEKNLAAGMKADDARDAAIRSFGGVDQIKERAREQRGFRWVGHIAQDVRFSVRSLIRSPGYAVSILVTLVLGIGVGSAVFNLCGESVLFSQPYPNASQLFVIGVNDIQNARNLTRPGRFFRFYQEQTNLFTEFAAVEKETSNVVVDGQPQASEVLRASADFFRTLGIRPALGRTFLPEEHFAGSDGVAVVSDLFWRQRLHGRSDALGQKIRIDRSVCTIVGVLAALQRFPQGFGGDVFRPMVPINEAKADVWGGWLSVIGRLRQGATTKQACAALTKIRLPAGTSPKAAYESPWAAEFLAAQKPSLFAIGDLDRPDVEWVAVGAAAMLYLIACTNAINLALVRNMRRRRELGIRLAIGGTRLQILRLLVVESAVLGIASCIAVIFIAHEFFPLISAELNGNTDARYASYLSAHSLACILGLGLLASFSIASASGLSFLRTRIDPALKEGGNTAGDNIRSVGARSALMALQAALAVILMLGTGLMIRTFEKLHHVDLGYNPEGKVKVKILFPPGTEPSNEVKLQIFDRLSERLASLPGVKGVSPGQEAMLLGFFGGVARLQMWDGTFIPVSGSFVSNNFQRVAGLTMKSGTWFSGRLWDSDVVINEALAKRRFGKLEPVGYSIRLESSGDHDYRIVGVVGDVRETVRSVAGPRIYFPSWMYPENVDTVVLSLEKNPSAGFDDLVRRTIYDLDPSLITSEVSSIDEAVGASLAYEKYAFKVLRALTLIGFFLAMIGVFSVIAYTVDCRMREFGVRMAVGADSWSLRRLVLRRGLAYTAIGVFIGIVTGLALTRFMRSILFETQPYDPPVYAVVSLALFTASTAACWIPALRASRVSVAQLLRSN